MEDVDACGKTKMQEVTTPRKIVLEAKDRDDETHEVRSGRLSLVDGSKSIIVH